MLVVEVGAGHVDQFGGLLLDGGDDLGMAVAGGGDGDAGGEIEELVAVDVGDDDAASALGDQRVGAGVGRRNVLASSSRTRRALGPGRAVTILGPLMGPGVFFFRDGGRGHGFGGHGNPPKNSRWSLVVGLALHRERGNKHAKRT